MTREELAKQKAQEVTSSGEFSPTLTECFIAGAEWEHKRLVKKACEWLENNFVCFLQGAKRGIYSNQFVTVNEMIDNFKRIMEE